MPATISGPKYRHQKPDIPFYKKGKYAVRFRPSNKITSLTDFRDRYEEFRVTAADRFMMHYYPEFWPGIEDNLDSIAPGYTDIFMRLYSEVKEDIIIRGYYRPQAPPLNKHFVVATYAPSREKSIDTIRLKLKNSTYFSEQRIITPSTDPEFVEDTVTLMGIPDMQLVVDFFNEGQPDGGIVGPDSETTFIIGSMMEENNLLNDGLASFATQFLGFPGKIEINLNFNFMQQEAQQAIGVCIKTLVEQLDTRKEVSSFSEADTLTIYFGHFLDKPNKKAISKMEFLVIEDSISPQIMAVGYLTNIKYNSFFKDPLTLSLLKNYDEVLEGIQSNQSGGPSNYSFSDFIMGLDPGSLGLDQNSALLSYEPPLKNQDIDDVFLSAASDLGLLSNTDELEKGFVTALTSDEIKALKKKVLENPEVAKKVFAEQKSKVLAAGVQVSSKLSKFLTEGPMGFAKKNSPLDLIFRQLGVQAIAKEAFICATFGLAPELERINQAIRNALSIEGQSIYLAPAVPSSAISKPDIDLEMFKPFSLTGDIWKQIIKILLDSLRNAVMEIMKMLADLLRELCDLKNPRAEDYGETDMTDFLPPNPPGTYPSNNSNLQRLAAKNNLSLDDLMQYIRDVSGILSSMEICYLFLDQSMVTSELLARIIAFNMDYNNDYVSSSLISENAIMGFFGDLSHLVDISDFCDQIADEVYALNEADICLTEKDIKSALDAENLDTLLDLLENGIQLKLPPINFECPDEAGFINNPLLDRTVPALLDLATEMIELQFINTVDATKQILLEPGITNKNDNSAALKALSYLPEGATEKVDKSKADGKILEKIMGVFEDIADTGEEMFDPDTGCDMSSFPQEVQVGMQAASSVMGLIVDVFSDPEFLAAIQGIQDKFDNISSLADPSATSTPRATYVFPSSFMRAYRDFIHERGPTYYRGSELTSSGQIRVQSGQFTATSKDVTLLGDPLYTMPTDAFDLDESANGMQFINAAEFSDSYKELTLNFNFKGSAGTDFLSITYPRTSDALAMTPFGSGSMANQFAKIRLVSAGSHATLLPDTTNFSITSSALDIIQNHFLPGLSSPLPDRLEVNPYVHNFTGPLMAAFGENREATSNAGWGGWEDEGMGPAFGNDAAALLREEAETMLFPAMFAGLTEGMSEYIRRNGTFTAAGVRRLQFFKNNKGCPPEDIADLLDAEGILEQVKKEFAESACFDDIPLPLKVRYSVLLSLFFSLIQISISEFLIKNIFAFSAFHIDDILEKPVIAQFFEIQIRNYMATRLQAAGRSNPDMRRAIMNYYNLKQQRIPVTLQGGLLDYNENIVFPTGTVFSEANWPALLEYLISERMHASKHTVANLILIAQGGGTKKSFDEVFVEDLLGFVSPALIDTGVATIERTMEEFLKELWGDRLASPGYGRMAFERYFEWDGLLGDREDEALAHLAIQELFDLTGESGGEMEMEEFYRRLILSGPRLANTGAFGGHPIAFVNGRIKYKLVYYFPTVNSQAMDIWSPPKPEPPIPVHPATPRTADGEILAGAEFWTLAETLVDDWELTVPDDFVEFWLHQTTSESGMFNPVAQFSAFEEEAARRKKALISYEFALKKRAAWEAKRSAQMTEDSQAYRDVTYAWTQYFGFTTPFGGSQSYDDDTVRSFFGPGGQFMRVVLADVENPNPAIITAGILYQGGSGDVPGELDRLENRLGYYTSYKDTLPTNYAINETAVIMASPTYKSFFHETFSQEIISMIPLYQNLYLTERFFPKVAQAFKSPKELAIRSFLDVLYEYETISPRDPTRQASQKALQATGGPDHLAKLESMGRDFILKMLIETPIQILKGIAEMIDPHVAIWKVVRNITGMAFSEIIKVLDGGVLEPLNTALEEIDVAPWTGEMFMAIILCVMDFGMKQLGDDISENAKMEIPDNIFPRMTLDGIDFTGTLTGLLAIPPLPFGILYILLELLKSELEDALTPANETSGDTSPAAC